VAVVVLAWGNIGVETENRNGEVYQYGACQGSESLSHCFRNWNRIVSDVKGAWFPTARKGELCRQIEDSLESKIKDDGLAGDELGEKLFDARTKIETIVGLDEIKADRVSRKGCPEKVPITCGKCGNQFETFEDAITVRCHKCDTCLPGPNASWERTKT
jgi:hypothetical protein